MKLRNKKTGGLANIMGDQSFFRVYTDAGWHDYDSLAELNAEWEDYKPAEPLIKDEKTRKAVRAWAEVNAIENVLYAERSDRSLYALTDMGDDDISIEIVGWIPTLKDGGEYTIAELCGEGEE